METQLREYQIAPGRMDEWLAGWSSGVVPLRQAAGFRVLGAWVDESHDRFVWLLSYNGPDGFAAAEAGYYSSQQRAALDPDPARFVVEAKHTMVRGVR
jgi:NIPSNAP protein